MSQNEIECACGARYAARAELAGRKVKCKRCGEVFVMPTNAPRTAARSSAAPVAPVAASGKPSPSRAKVAPRAAHVEAERWADEEPADEPAPPPRMMPKSPAVRTGNGFDATAVLRSPWAWAAGAFIVAMTSFYLFPSFGKWGALATVAIGFVLILAGFIWWMLLTIRAFRPVPIWLAVACVMMPIVTVVAGTVAAIKHWRVVRPGLLTFAAGIVFTCVGMPIAMHGADLEEAERKQRIDTAMRQHDEYQAKSAAERRNGPRMMVIPPTGNTP